MRNYLTLRKAVKKKLPTTRDRNKERKEFLIKLDALPKMALRAFTDGSSYGNPGPAGTGFLLFHASDSNFARMYSSEFISPHASNNEAELCGLRSVLQALLGIPALPPAQVFIDSQYALNSALGKTTPRAHQALINEIQTLLTSLRRRTPTTLFWVPGHAQVPEQELTDLLAKRGAKGCTSLEEPTPQEIADHQASSIHSQLRRTPRTRTSVGQGQRHNGIDYSMI